MGKSLRSSQSLRTMIRTRMMKRRKKLRLDAMLARPLLGVPAKIIPGNQLHS